MTTTSRRWLASVALTASAVVAVAPPPIAAQTRDPILCTAETSGAATFGDLAANNPHRSAIDCLVHYGVTRGRTATSYAPEHSLTRAQAASLLFRVTELADKGWRGTRDHFGDDNGSVHEPAINALAENAILRGTSARTFSPHAPLTRGQAATLTVRSFELLMKAPLPAGADAFDDDDGHPHEADINKAAALGILNGTGVRRFEPDRPIRRDEAASVMARALEAMAQAFLGGS